MLRVARPDAVTVAGENAPVAPAGSPLTENDTTPENPFSAATVAVYDVADPGEIVTDDGAAFSVKSGGPVTVRVTVAVRASAPLVPVIVSA
jgi:hypothetical protein